MLFRFSALFQARFLKCLTSLTPIQLVLSDQADANAYDLTGRTTVLKLGQTPGDAEEEFMEYKIHLLKASSTFQDVSGIQNKRTSHHRFPFPNLRTKLLNAINPMIIIIIIIVIINHTKSFTSSQIRVQDTQS